MFQAHDGTSNEQTVKILVVDDSLSARRAVTLLCKEKGWDVIEAQNGIVGLELAEQENWTAIVTDFDMPQMDGLTATRSIQEQQSRTRVIIVTQPCVGTDRERVADRVPKIGYRAAVWAVHRLAGPARSLGAVRQSVVVVIHAVGAVDFAAVVATRRDDVEVVARSVGGIGA